MSKFTPGPWAVFPHKDRNSVRYIRPANADGMFPEIAACFLVEGAEREADMTLIAAAPRMYEALRQIAAEDHPDGFFARIANKALEGLE